METKSLYETLKSLSYQNPRGVFKIYRAKKADSVWCLRHFSTHGGSAAPLEFTGRGRGRSLRSPSFTSAPRSTLRSFITPDSLRTPSKRGTAEAGQKTRIFTLERTGGGCVCGYDLSLTQPSAPVSEKTRPSATDKNEANRPCERCLKEDCTSLII